MKLLDLSKKISLVASPVDLRRGWRSLSVMAAAFLNIDVTEGEDIVVFISKNGKLCKVIGADEKGTYVLTRKLYEGCFQRLMTRIENSQAEPLSVKELERYLDGEKIQEKRSRLECF